jgi:hypothetical protein
MAEQDAEYAPIDVTLEKIDWTLLRQQKLDLLSRIADEDPLMGLVHFLDYIQDQAAEELGEEAIFGPRPDDEIDRSEPENDVPFRVGQRVRMRPEFRHVSDFDEAIVSNIDHRDRTVDVKVNGEDWGQWFCRLDDGTYEIEPVPEQEQQ